MDDKKSPMRRPVDWVFHATLLLLGAVMALNLTIVLLRPILPWILGGSAVVGITWIVVALVRWRRSRW